MPQDGQCHFVCQDKLLGTDQTKYLVRSIIITKTIIRIKNKTKRWTSLLIINSLTYVCVSGRKNFFRIFSERNFFEEHCLERNLILILNVSFRLYSGTWIKEASFIADISVWCVPFLGTMKPTDWTTNSKSYKKSNYCG